MGVSGGVCTSGVRAPLIQFHLTEFLCETSEKCLFLFFLSASEASQYLCMRQKSVNQYVRRVHKNEWNVYVQYKISLLSNFISFASLIYMYVYVRTFLNSICSCQYFAIEIQVLQNGRISSMSGRSSLLSSPLCVSSFSSKHIRHYAHSQSGSYYWFIINKYYKKQL